MTFEDLRSVNEKKSRRAAILDRNFNIIWDKDGFFGSWIKIDFPKKEDFFNKKEIIISLGSAQTKIPVSISKIALSGGETYYVCEAFSRESVAELTAKSEISEIFKNFVSEINNKIHTIQHSVEMCISNPLVMENEDLLWNYKNQDSAIFDLLALSTNLNFYFNTFSYYETGKTIDVFENLDRLIKKSNKLLGSSTAIILHSKSSNYHVEIYEQVFTVVILNLIQNALAYSKDDKKIEISLYCDNNNVTISFTNKIEPGKDPSSYSVNDAVNAKLGIGLPLVERIVKGIGGSFFKEHTGETYRAHITLPLFLKGNDENLILKQPESNFIINNQDNYIRRYLNQFIEK